MLYATVYLVTKKENPQTGKAAWGLGFLAESQGFEPWVPCGTRHFECRTFDLSDNSPDSYIISLCERIRRRIGKINRQDKTKITYLNRLKCPILCGFQGDKAARPFKNFECAIGGPLESAK